LVFVINKLDAVDNPTLAFRHIGDALSTFAQKANIHVHATVPISALKGWNVVKSKHHWCGYTGESLLSILEHLPTTPPDRAGPTWVCVQWVEKQHDSARTDQGRRVFWGRVASGALKVGDEIEVHPSQQRARVAQILNATRQSQDDQLGQAGQSVGVILDREVDVSRGDWLIAPSHAPESHEAHEGLETPILATQSIQATVAWMDTEPLVRGRTYWALHGHQWVKTQVSEILHAIDILTLEPQATESLKMNAIGRVELKFKEPIMAQNFQDCRLAGSMILVDTATHQTAGAVLIDNRPHA
jgi:sulfate adenylyltransferase subunit 1